MYAGLKLRLPCRAAAVLVQMTHRPSSPKIQKSRAKGQWSVCAAAKEAAGSKITCYRDAALPSGGG